MDMPNRNHFILLATAAMIVPNIVCGIARNCCPKQRAVSQLGRTATGDQTNDPTGYIDDPNIEHLMPPANTALIAALNGKGVENWAERLQVPAVVQSEYKTLKSPFWGLIRWPKYGPAISGAGQPDFPNQL